jgi:hypothetical protein
MIDGEDGNPSIRRVRSNSGISRSSSLPTTTKRLTNIGSPSPRLARRGNRIVEVSGLSPARSCSPSAEYSNVHGLEGVLVLEIEPAQFGRFRYEAEGRQNSLEGCDSDTFPTVRVSPEWISYVPDGTVVNVSLVRRHDLKPHHHMLASKDGTDTRQVLCDGRATFPNLVVRRHRSALRYSPEDQRAVRLLFTLSFMKDGTATDACCVSKPIFNSDLKIVGCSHRSGTVNGTDAIVLCSKVRPSCPILFSSMCECVIRPFYYIIFEQYYIYIYIYIKCYVFISRPAIQL